MRSILEQWKFSRKLAPSRTRGSSNSYISSIISRASEFIRPATRIERPLSSPMFGLLPAALNAISINCRPVIGPAPGTCHTSPYALGLSPSITQAAAASSMNTRSCRTSRFPIHFAFLPDRAAHEDWFHKFICHIWPIVISEARYHHLHLTVTMCIHQFPF